MAQAIRPFSLGKQQKAAQNQQHRDLSQALSHTRMLIQQAYGGFNNVKDQDLIESYVFEINSLQARYNYLLRQLKQLEEEI